MTRLFSIIILVLAIVLFPPAVLAVVSNNAVPGDSTYPIKRGLEDVIYAVASLNPNTKALFAKARSDRRFQEITVLFTQGKEAGKTLNELVEQTQVAANQINQVSDSNQKGRLISQLSESIVKYDQGLSKVSKPQPPSVIQPPIPNQSPTPVPTVAPSSTSASDAELAKTREELEKIKRQLEELERERQLQLQQQYQTQNPTPAPTPTLKPSPTPTPKPTFVPNQVSVSTPTPSPSPSASPVGGGGGRRPAGMDLDQTVGTVSGGIGTTSYQPPPADL